MTLAHSGLFIPNSPIPFSGVLGPDVEGFSVPTFRTGERNFVQQVRAGGLVDGFMPLKPSAYDTVRPVEHLQSGNDRKLGEIYSAQGDEARFAFQFNDSRIAVASKSEMTGILQQYVALGSSLIAPLALVSVLEFLAASQQVNPNDRRAAIGRARDWLLGKGVSQARHWERSQLVRSGLISSYEREMRGRQAFRVDEQIPQQMIFQGVSFGVGNLFNHPYFVTVDHEPALQIGYGQIPIVSLRNPRTGKTFIEGNHVVDNIVGMLAFPEQRALSIVCGLFTILRLAVQENAVRLQHIDLRPIGIAIFGSEYELNVAGQIIPNPQGAFVGNSIGVPLEVAG